MQQVRVLYPNLFSLGIALNYTGPKENTTNVHPTVSGLSNISGPLINTDNKLTPIFSV